MKTTRGGQHGHSEREEPEGRAITVNVRAGVEGAVEHEPAPPSLIAVFDENGELITTSVVEKGKSRLMLPGTLRDRMVQVFHVPVPRRELQLTPAVLRRLNAVEERLLVRPDLELKLRPALIKW